jgi:2-desacetyl-2-hydroxyethyl bacteriochlorophyllide A dehydrogenase
MKAIVLRDGDTITLDDRPSPDTRPGEVLVRPDHVGICGTDLHAPLLKDLFVPDVIMGHEFSGEVVDVAPGVEGWQPGDRVTINPNGDVCGECDQCRAGRPNLCRPTVLGNAIGVHRDGGMASLVSLPPAVLHRLPDGVSGLRGAFVEPLAVVVRLVRVAGFKLGDRAVVLGGGPIGLLTVQVLRRAGASHIAVVEPSSSRREMAGRLGADIVIDPGADDPAALFGGDLPAPDHVFECAGIPSGVRTAAAIVKPAGTVAVVGICPEPLDMDVSDLIFKELVIRGSIIYVEEFPAAIRLLEQGAIDVESMITRVMALDDYDEALGLLAQPDESVKILLRP